MASWRRVAWMGLWLNRGIGGVSGSRLCGWREDVARHCGWREALGLGAAILLPMDGTTDLEFLLRWPPCWWSRPPGARRQKRPGHDHGSNGGRNKRPGNDRARTAGKINDQETTGARKVGERNDQETTGARTVGGRKRQERSGRGSKDGNDDRKKRTGEIRARLERRGRHEG